MVCGSCTGGQQGLEDIMRSPCTDLLNWDDILDEICRSNILQRDNLKFIKARSGDSLWCERSRRKVMYSIMTEWTCLGHHTDVKHLVAALSLPGWFDVKLRVIKLLRENCSE